MDTANGSCAAPCHRLQRKEQRSRERQVPVPSDFPRSKLLKKGWDDALRASYQVYGAVRRHL
jgi:hypothetical protein